MATLRMHVASRNGCSWNSLYEIGLHGLRGRQLTCTISGVEKSEMKLESNSWALCLLMIEVKYFFTRNSSLIVQDPDPAQLIVYWCSKNYYSTSPLLILRYTHALFTYLAKWRNWSISKIRWQIAKPLIWHPCCSLISQSHPAQPPLPLAPFAVRQMRAKSLRDPLFACVY